MRELHSDHRLARVFTLMQDVTDPRSVARRGGVETILTRDFRFHPRSRPATP
jgi:hypothetical protein